jgi:hypothetical protein
MKATDRSVIPMIRLFTAIVKGQKEKTTSNTYQSSYGGNTQNASTYSQVTTSGNVMTSYSYPPTKTEESIYSLNDEPSKTTEDVKENKENEKELTMTEVLNNLQKDQSVVEVMLANLQAYCKAVRAANVDAHADRKKVFVQSKTMSHADEIEERLTFLKYYASVSDFKFLKVQLRVIYDSLSV